MYEQHFGLEHEPFSIAPDPRYLYLGERHREALAHLLYGLDSGGGVVLLTGEIGAGKTTVCRCFLEQVPPHCQVAYVFNPKLTVTELLSAVCQEFGVAVPEPGMGPATVTTYIDPLNRFLLAAHAAGRNCVLVIDEAQQLAPEVLEQLRLLTNLETSERKLLQIVLIGQPELRELLAGPDLAALAQRVIARYHLGPLDAADVAPYIDHRLAVAGLRGPTPLGPGLARRIHRLSGGIPRRINLLCDRALLGAYSRGMAAVDRRTLNLAAREVFGPQPDVRSAQAAWRPGVRTARWGWMALGATVGAAGLAAVWWTLQGQGRSPVFAAASMASAASVSPRSASAPGPRAAAAASRPAASAPAASGTAAAVAAMRASAGAPATASTAASLAAPAGSASSPAAPAPPLLSLAQLRERQPALRLDEDAAWRQLAAVWGSRLPAGDACTVAARERLNCYRTRSGLLRLRNIDRPAILVLRDGDGPAMHVLLVGLGAKQVWLTTGKDSFALTLDDLAVWWQGEFGTLWRSGSVVSDAGPNRAGYDPELARRLAQVDASGVLAGNAAELRVRLARFQMSRGLMPDGSIGPLTDMMINRAAGIDEPRLAVAP